ncbi:MAG: hypothetical protein GXO47_10010, partial [Chlorobi bacterium]|nr:hypothetical protein [Chlorobiota bacterium]
QDTTITYIPINRHEYTTDSVGTTDPIVNFFNKNASKKQINKWIYDLLINEKKPPQKKDINFIVNYSDYNGKRIKNIYFKRLPPFGASVKDTSRKDESWIAKVGNNTRIPTSTFILKNNITLKKGGYVTQEKIEESERLLRKLGYISEAKIIVKKNPVDTNYVDILVISKDQFPHAFDIGLVHNYPKIKLYSLNLFGQGLGFSQSFTFTPKDDPRHGYVTGLRVRNLYGSLIDLDGAYTNQNFKEELYLKANRSFYRKETRDAGGIIINRSYKNYSITGSEQIYLNTPLDYFISDIWYGHAFNIKKYGYFNKTTLYISFQNINSNFYEIADSLSVYPYFNKNHFYFISASLAKRDYYKNKLIYSFGRTEDVPYGFMASMTYGFNHTDTLQRHFIGLHFNTGRTIVPNRGYLALSVDASTFFYNNKQEQGSLKVTGTYISNLIKTKCCKLRNFIDLIYLRGFNRLPFEYTYLNESDDGITGFSSMEERGKEKFVIKTENVLFKPKRLWGFQFAYFSFFDMGFIGDGHKIIFSNTPYFSLGVGLRIRNDNLVFKTLQIRFAFLPIVPDGMDFYNIDIRNESLRSFDDFYPEIPFKPVFY